MSTHVYNIANDFPNQAVDTEVLLAEINGSSIGPGHNYSVNDDGTDITIEAEPDLDAGEVTVLDGIVAAHQGVPFVDGTQRVSALAEQTNATTTFEDAVALQSGPLRAGTYLVTFSYEISQQNLLSTSGCQARLNWNGGTEVATSVTTLDTYDLRGVSATIDVGDGDTPLLTLQWRRVGLANTARIRRCRISLSPMADVGEE